MIVPSAEYFVALALETVLFTVIATGLAQNGLYALQLAIALVELAAQRPERRIGLLWRRYAEISPPISLLVPAYNEEKSIVDSLRSMLALNYPDFEVIAINDGSKDATLAAMIGGLGLEPVSRFYPGEVPHKAIRGFYACEQHPKLLVIDKENGGKSDALNAGIDLSRFPIFCAVDADSILESDALLRAVQPFVDDPSRTVAVGGTIRIANGCRIERGRVLAFGLPRNLLALFQTVEYLRAFLMARLAWSRLKTLTIISGAFGLFRRDVAVAVGATAMARWARTSSSWSRSTATCATVARTTASPSSRSPCAGPRRPRAGGCWAGSAADGSAGPWRPSSGIATCFFARGTAASVSWASFTSCWWTSWVRPSRCWATSSSRRCGRSASSRSITCSPTSL